MSMTWKINAKVGLVKKRDDQASGSGPIADVGLFDHIDQSQLVIGRHLREEITRVRLTPAQAGWDFLSLALAVIAADTICLRAQAADGWSRCISLSVPVHNPEKWRPHVPLIERLLMFLSGDFWTVSFSAGGIEAVDQDAITNERTVCLFSGGLDSTIGVHRLLRSGTEFSLASQAYTKDFAYQERVLASLAPQRTAAWLHPNVELRWSGPHDTSMRTRSLLFLALAQLWAGSSDSSPVTAVVLPENGFISINPPLTLQRLGSLSTRTTHPYFLELLAELWDAVGIRACIQNPYSGTTKGEMVSGYLASGGDPVLLSSTVSCGKWKRKNKQCGRCVPCLIRRAAFHHSGIQDSTPYTYTTLVRDFPDVAAFLHAERVLGDIGPRRWAERSGPIPSHVLGVATGVVERGLQEVVSLLRALL